MDRTQSFYANGAVKGRPSVDCSLNISFSRKALYHTVEQFNVEFLDSQQVAKDLNSYLSCLDRHICPVG